MPRPPTTSSRLRVFFRLGCLFVLVPLLELALLLRVGQWIGVWPTVAIVAVTGVIGAALVRQQGTRTLVAVQLEIASGRVPTRALLDGAALLVAASFLLTPGVLTDVAGFALLLPPVRSLLYVWVKQRIARAIAKGTVRMSVWGAGFGRPGEGPPQAQPGSPPGRADLGRGPDDDDEPEPPRRPGEIVQ